MIKANITPKYLSAFILLAASIIYLGQDYTRKFSAQPEVIDKYPLFYLLDHQEGMLYGGIKAAFNSCNGEACVPDSLTASLCKNPQVCMSRTRNLNYFFDYVDAIFFKKINSHFGMISNTIGNLIVFLLMFFAFRAYKPEVKPWKVAIIATPFLFLPHVLTMDSMLYRSGKILTLVYLAFLFFLYAKLKSCYEIKFSVRLTLFLIFAWAICSLLILSDEIAVFVTGMVFSLFFFRSIIAQISSHSPSFEKKINFTVLAFSLSLLVWYLVFRFIIEPSISSWINGITIVEAGTYSDPTTFLSLNVTTYIKSVVHIALTSLYAISIPTTINDNLWFYFSLAMLIVFSLVNSSRQALKNSLSNKFHITTLSFVMLIVTLVLIQTTFDNNAPLPKFSLLLTVSSLGLYWLLLVQKEHDKFIYEGLGLFFLWTLCLYVMGLRHTYIVTAPFNGTMYYFMPTAFLTLLFITLLVLKTDLLNKKSAIFIIFAYIGFGFGNLSVIEDTSKNNFWFPTEDNSLIKQAAENPNNFFQNLSNKQEKFYIGYHRFFQGLIATDTSCLYNTCKDIAEKQIPIPSLLSGEQRKYQLEGPFKVGQIIEVHLPNDVKKGYHIEIQKDDGTNCCIINTYPPGKITSLKGDLVLFPSNGFNLIVKNTSNKNLTPLTIKIFIKGAE